MFEQHQLQIRFQKFALSLLIHISRPPSPVSRPNWHLHHRSCIRKELERIQLEAAEKLEATLEAEQAKIRARRKLQRDMYKVRCASFALRLYVVWRHVQAC